MKLRILVISNLFPPQILGGYEILCKQVCEELQGLGHEVMVLTTGEGTKETRPWVKRSLKLFLPFHQKARGFHRFRQSLCYAHNYGQTRSWIERFQPDLVFIWSQRRLTLASARACQAAGVKTVYTFNDEYLDFYQPRPGLGPLSFAGLDFTHTTCISEKLKQNLLSLEAPLEKSRVIYQGIPLQRFPARQRPLKKVETFLYVGQLHRYKGVHTAVRAAASLEFPLTIVGAGCPRYEREIRCLAAELGASVNFLGRQSPSALSALYRAHDAFLFCSEWEEPFGLTHLEAMASGLPVISTVHGGQGEFLIPEENCLAFAPGSSEELALQMDRLRRDSQLAHRLATAGRATVENDFTLSSYVQQLEQFLKETLA